MKQLQMVRSPAPYTPNCSQPHHILVHRRIRLERIRSRRYESDETPYPSINK